MCGAHDPDCDITGAPVVGCTTGQKCDATTDMCVDACTVNTALATPTLSSQSANYDATYDVTTYDGALNADAAPDYLDIELYNGVGVFASGGVVPGTYQLTGAELDYATCGACVLLFGNVDTTGGTITQYYMAQGGTLKLTATTGANLTGTLTNMTFASVTIDPDTFESTPDGNACTSSITSAAFTAPLTMMSSITKTQSVRVHINNTKTSLKSRKKAHSAKKMLKK
jgi:hypothetical protein